MIPSPAAPHRPSGSAPSGVYLDHAATTQLCAAAIDAISGGFELFGNPSSRHTAGQDARDAIDDARAQVGVLLGCEPDEVVFTGSGSEAINLALRGTFATHGWRGHLVVTAIEHSAVLESAEALRRAGVAVSVVLPGPGGHVDADDVARAMRPDTVLVSVMHANNETGAIQPVQEITRRVHDAGKLMHIDAVQTAGKLPIDELDADLVSISAHKFNGPKGVGALKVRTGVPLTAIVCGGGHEAGRRAGTENTLGVLGMAAAAREALGRIADASQRPRRAALRARLLGGLAELDGVHTNGTAPVMAETVNVSFDGVRGDTLADLLDMQGIYVSTGSACHAADSHGSHVLIAMGIDAQSAAGALRFSFGSATTAEQIDLAARRTVAAVRQLRGVGGVGGARPLAVAA